MQIISSALDDIFYKYSEPQSYENGDGDEYFPGDNKKEVPPGPYYHGTRAPNLTHILPASQTGQKGYTETDPNYSYATPSLKNAWNYAMEAGDKGPPRVYEVHPLGGQENMERDPERDEQGRTRETKPRDLRASQGFKVVREMETPPHVKDYINRWGV